MKNAFRTKVSSLPGSAFVDDARPRGHEPYERITIGKMLPRRESVKDF